MHAIRPEQLTVHRSTHGRERAADSVPLCAVASQSGRFQVGVCRSAVEESQSDKRRQLERRGVIRHSHSNRAALSALLATLQQQSLLPTVIFAFSKRVCEDSAYRLHHVDLTTHSEKSHILVFFNAAINRLHRQDRVLPQVLHVKEMSVRGISTHHAGMLPILKEVVEMLFGRGLIKGTLATSLPGLTCTLPFCAAAHTQAAVTASLLCPPVLFATETFGQSHLTLHNRRVTTRIDSAPRQYIALCAAHLSLPACLLTAGPTVLSHGCEYADSHCGVPVTAQA